MTRDEMMSMAREVGFEQNSLGMTYTSGALPDLLERFADLIAAAERKPLTIEQIDRMWADEWDGFISFEEAKVIVHSVEQAHGIK